GEHEAARSSQTSGPSVALPSARTTDHWPRTTPRQRSTMRACTAPPAGVARDQPGSEPVPGYRLLERIGVGGAGEVGSGEALGGLGVALKIVRLVGGLGQRERTSLRVLRAIRHPNLLAYFGAWQSEDRLIIGMELADRSLWDRFVEATGQGLAGI